MDTVGVHKRDNDNRGARGRLSTVFVCFDRGDLLRVMGGPAHREADTLDLELGIHEMGWMDGMLLVGVCASVYLMRCPSFWSRPLSGYLLGLTGMENLLIKTKAAHIFS